MLPRGRGSYVARLRQALAGRYTLAEVEDMRESLYALCHRWGVSYNPEALTAQVEHELRTAMAAGVSPRALRERAEQHEREESERRQREFERMQEASSPNWVE